MDYISASGSDGYYRPPKGYSSQICRLPACNSWLIVYHLLKNKFKIPKCDPGYYRLIALCFLLGYTTTGGNSQPFCTYQLFSDDSHISLTFPHIFSRISIEVRIKNISLWNVSSVMRLVGSDDTAVLRSEFFARPCVLKKLWTLWTLWRLWTLKEHPDLLVILI